MSIFDRKRPLKTLKRYMSRFFTKKSSERVDFIDTTRPVQLSSEEMGSPGTGGYNDNDPEELNPNDDSIVSTQSIIQDKDKDTKVDTEESADEDKIRFDTGGNERFRMEGNDTSGGALYIKEGAGTTAPSTPSSGEGVFYEKNDGKIYFKNDGGTEYDLTSGGGGGGGMTSFDITGDSGSAQTVEDGNTVDIEGGTGINTVAGATDKVTINCDLEGTELKSTGETGGNKFLREDGDGTCSWAITSGSGGTVQGTDNTYDIEAANQGATAGSARGENSVDLQTKRDVGTDVASGACAGLLAGENNEAAHDHSGVFVGKNNRARGVYSVVLGGLNNDINATHNNSAIIGGATHEIDSDYTGILAGYDNAADGGYSAIVGGHTNAITGAANANHSAIIGGILNNANSALQGVIVGGKDNTATSENGVVMGEKGKTKRTGEFVIGGNGGATFAVGEAQCGMAIWSGRTTNNSATELFLANDGSSRFTLDTDSAVTFEIQLTAVDEASPGTINAGAKFLGMIVNDSAATSIAGQGSITKTANPSTLFAAGGGDADVTADNTNNSIKITVTGITGKNIRWVCSMRYTEVVI